MKFLTRISVLLCVTIMFYLDVFMFMFAFNYIELDKVSDFLTVVYGGEALQMISGVVACVLFFLNFILYRTFSSRSYKGNTIAFDNPSGRVSVSLLAIEDLTKRAIRKAVEVKEAKVKIAASKKGLRIKITLTLRVEGSIPEVTSRVQELVKQKVQDAIGLDEPINVSIYVGKILPDQAKEKRVSKSDDDDQESEQNVPFRGYRA